MSTIHLDAKLVPSHLRGSYSGQKFKARIVETVTIPAEAGLWSGGSRDTYTAIDFTTGRQVTISDNMSAPWDNRRDNEVTLSPQFCIVEHSIFCGKDMGLTFYVHPATATKWLPASVDLNEHEKIILQATASLKSSYNGRDRFQMACEKYGQAPRMTRAQWDAAKLVLIGKGLLNKAGAITTAGRNAIPNRY